MYKMYTNARVHQIINNFCLLSEWTNRVQMHHLMHYSAYVFIISFFNNLVSFRMLPIQYKIRLLLFEIELNKLWNCELLFLYIYIYGFKLLKIPVYLYFYTWIFSLLFLSYFNIESFMIKEQKIILHYIV